MTGAVKGTELVGVQSQSQSQSIKETSCALEQTGSSSSTPSLPIQPAPTPAPIPSTTPSSHSSVPHHSTLAPTSSHPLDASTSAPPSSATKPPSTNTNTKRKYPGPPGLPKEWSATDLLATKNGVLKKLKTVATTGGLLIESTLQPLLLQSLTASQIPTTPTSPLPGPQIALQAGLHSSLFPRILTRWRTWCTSHGLASLPIMGATVCIFLSDGGIPPAERQQMVFVLELVRRATTKCFLNVDREGLRERLTWDEEKWTTWDVVLQQAQWALPEWKAIAELAPPVLAVKPTSLVADTPTPPPPARSTLQSSGPPQPHPNTKYLAPGQRRLSKTGTSSSSSSTTPNVPPPPPPPPQQPPQPTRPAPPSTSLPQPRPPPPPPPAPASKPPAPLSAKAQGKRPATGPPAPSTNPPAAAPSPPKRKRRTKVEMERERAHVEEEMEERAFYASAARLSTSISMLAVLLDSSYKPSSEMQVIAGGVLPLPPPPIQQDRRETMAIVSAGGVGGGGGGSGPVVAATLPPSHALSLPQNQSRLSHPFLEYTPSLAAPAWAATVPTFSPIDNGLHKPFLPLSLTPLPLPQITSLPVPNPPPQSTFLLSPRQLLPWPKAIQPLTQEIINSSWETIQNTMTTVAASQQERGAASSEQEVVQSAIRLVEPWCPKAKSPKEQVEAARAREEAGGKNMAVKASPRIPVLSMSSKGSPRLAVGQLDAVGVGKGGVLNPVVTHSPLAGNASSSASSSRESTPMMSRRPSLSRSSTGNGTVHPLAQMWAKGTIEQRQVARELLLGAKGRSSPRSEHSPRLADVALQSTSPLSTATPLPSTSDKPPLARTISAPPTSTPASTAATAVHDSHPTAPPLVPLPNTSATSPTTSTVPTLTPQLPLAADLAGGSHPTRLGASKLSTSVVARADSPLGLGVNRENSLLLEDGPAPSAVAAGEGSNSALEVERTKRVEVEVAVKEKGKGKEKVKEVPKLRERESRAVVLSVQEKKKETLQERKEAQKRRGGVPFRFQVLNTPIRPFG